MPIKNKLRRIIPTNANEIISILEKILPNMSTKHQHLTKLNNEK